MTTLEHSEIPVTLGFSLTHPPQPVLSQYGNSQEEGPIEFSQPNFVLRLLVLRRRRTSDPTLPAPTVNTRVVGERTLNFGQMVNGVNKC